MKQNEHGRLVASAAKAHCRSRRRQRDGQTRRWRSDQRFWRIGIGFQPSGWLKGSYLNVGVSWFRYAKPYSTYEFGLTFSPRIADFAGFEAEEQFALAADRLAARTAEAAQ